MLKKQLKSWVERAWKRWCKTAFYSLTCRGSLKSLGRRPGVYPTIHRSDTGILPGAIIGMHSR